MASHRSLRSGRVESLRSSPVWMKYPRANERRLVKIWGRRLWEVAYRMKSNDQVTYGMRLWLRDRLREIEEHLVAFLRVMTSRVKYGIDVLMPGYTHLQRAQPIRRSRWILSYGPAFVTHLERLRDVIKRVDCSPLGLGSFGRQSIRHRSRRYC